MNNFLSVLIIGILTATTIGGYALFFDRAIPKDENKELNANSVLSDSESVNIFFVGDLMLDRYNRVLLDRYGVGHFTENIRSIFDNSDLTVANLEGSITNEDTVSLNTKNNERNHFQFTFDKKNTIEFLGQNKIGLVSLGNNHVLNFGEDGLNETMRVLSDNNIEYFGNPVDSDNAHISRNVNGLDIAFVNYNAFAGPNIDEVSDIIKKLSKKYFVSVYAHWGPEYELSQSERQNENAHKFIDSGADLIIGTHPHVIQPVEIYKGKVIFYSLGNFVFDQYFSEDVKNELAVNVSVSQKGLNFELIPLNVSSDGKLDFGNEIWRNDVLKRISENSDVGEEIKDNIKKGMFYIER
ncbi:CapA family protein [Patescibacteria group bacterium]